MVRSAFGALPPTSPSEQPFFGEIPQGKSVDYVRAEERDCGAAELGDGGDEGVSGVFMV